MKMSFINLDSIFRQFASIFGNIFEQQMKKNVSKQNSIESRGYSTTLCFETESVDYWHCSARKK